MQTVEFTIKFKYDPYDNKGLPLRIFLFQFFNRLSYNNEIKEITYKGEKRIFTNQKEIRDLPLKKKDSIKK